MLHQHCIWPLKAHLFWIIVCRWADKAPRIRDWDYLCYFLLRSLFPTHTVAAAQRSLCVCRPSVVSHRRAAINSPELLSPLNSVSSARSCRLELHRALQPPFCPVRGKGDKASNDHVVSTSCLTLEVRQEVDEDFLSHSVGGTQVRG